MASSALMCLALCLVASKAAQRGGAGSVQIVDNCTPGDASTCPACKCCVKEAMAYTDEYTGTKYDYRIACRAMGTRGSACFVNNDYPDLCPCSSGLTCQPGAIAFFGRCH